MRCCLLDSKDPRWLEMLAGTPHEFYHLPGYAELEAARMGGAARAVWVEDSGRQWLLPLVVRSLKGLPGAVEESATWHDAVSPYGYPHPLIQANTSEVEPFVRAALAAAQTVLQAEKVLAVFVRCSPLESLAPAYAECGTVVAHGPCYWLDLSEAPESLHQQLRSRYRSYLNALRREGVEAVWAPFSEGLGTFLDLYYRTMDRVGAARWYYFSRDYFEHLALLLGENLWLCEVRWQGQVLASGLFAASGRIVQYLFSGVDERLGQPHATKLMMVEVRDRARAAGYRFFHLGGGVGGAEDALAQFKRGFTRHASPFRSWRWVVEAERYRAQVRAWEQAAGVPAEGLTGYFPAYRKPLPGADRPASPAVSTGSSASPAA
mgnify:CR=1 FL=1